MGRAPCCDKANVKRGAWSSEEDAKLKAYIQQHGTGGNWIALPHKIGLKRCGKSCRLRWLNYLRPNIKHGGFSQEEDNIISSLYINIGSRWSIIAAQLPGRTDNDIKNYWNTKLKKKLIGKHLKLEQSRRLATTDHNFNPLYPGPFMDQSLAYRPALAPTCTQLDKMLTHHHDHDPSLDMINNFPATTTAQFGEGQTSLFQGVQTLQAELDEVIYSNPQIQSGGSSEGFYGFDLLDGTSSASAESGTLGEIDSSFVCLPQLVSDCETYQRGDIMIQDDSSCLFAFEEY